MLKRCIEDETSVRNVFCPGRGARGKVGRPAEPISYPVDTGIVSREVKQPRWPRLSLGTASDMRVQTHSGLRVELSSAVPDFNQTRNTQTCLSKPFQHELSRNSVERFGSRTVTWRWMDRGVGVGGETWKKVQRCEQRIVIVWFSSVIKAGNKRLGLRTGLPSHCMP